MRTEQPPEREPKTMHSTEHEAQRIAHLVHGAPRPKAERAPAPKRKGSNRIRKEMAPGPIVTAPTILLAPGIEERVALREAWSHKQGSPETHAHVAREAKREGALARLVRSEAIDANQLAAAQEIAVAHHAIAADVAVRTARMERTGGGPDAAAAPHLAAVIRERAYSQWRDAVAPHGAMLLAIIVDDVALTAAARRWRMSDRRARSILIAALDRWRRG